MSDDKRMTDARKAELRERTVGESCFTDDEMTEALNAIDAAEARHQADLTRILEATLGAEPGSLPACPPSADGVVVQANACRKMAEAAEARAAEHIESHVLVLRYASAVRLGLTDDAALTAEAMVTRAIAWAKEGGRG